MDIEPEIKEDGDNEPHESAMKEERQEVDQNNSAMEEEKGQKFVEEIKIGDETIFTIPIDLQEQENNLVHR